MNDIEQIKSLIEQCRKEKCVCRFRVNHQCDDCNAYDYLLFKLNNPATSGNQKEVTA